MAGKATPLKAALLDQTPDRRPRQHLRLRGAASRRPVAAPRRRHARPGGRRRRRRAARGSRRRSRTCSTRRWRPAARRCATTATPTARSAPSSTASGPTTAKAAACTDPGLPGHHRPHRAERPLDVLLRGRASARTQRPGSSALLPRRHQLLHHRRIGQGRGVAERAEFVFGDLAQDAAHDLAGAGLGQAGRELDDVGRGDRADLACGHGRRAPCAGPHPASTPCISVT